MPAPVSEVLARRAAGNARLREVVRMLAAHRLLIPLLEVDADLLEGDDTDPCAGQDRAVAAVSARTEQGVVGLAFTGLAAMARWNAAARPMPVASTRVAQALLAEGAVALQIDPGVATGTRLDRLALDRLARGGAWPEPWDDPVVRQAIVGELGPALASGELAVRLKAPEPDPAAAYVGAGSTGKEGPPADLVVEVRFPSGNDSQVAQQRAAIVAERLATSADLRSVFDGTMAIRVV